MLEEADWPLFNALRDWRNGQAREEGIPAYVICTNRQLAAIAHARPDSLAKLGAVEGLGRAKLERYGGPILALAASSASCSMAPGPSRASGPSSRSPKACWLTWQRPSRPAPRSAA
ncbi:MAG: HRDC domain-containing protein [Candidatus Latescibacterota bacterium]